MVMAIKKVFVDGSGTEMECFVNANNKLVIQVGDLDDSYNMGIIALDYEDALVLVQDIAFLIDDMRQS